MTQASEIDKTFLDIRKCVPSQKKVKSFVIDDEHCPVHLKDSLHDSKLCEAILHPDKKRVTVAFHGFGAFTYLLRERGDLSKGLHNWHGEQQ